MNYKKLDQLCFFYIRNRIKILKAFGVFYMTEAWRTCVTSNTFD